MNSKGVVNSKGVPGTDCEGMYLVRELVNYADSLRNVINSYVAINTEWLPEVLMCCTITINKYSYLVIISIIKSSLERRNVFNSHIQCLQKTC